MSDEHNEHFGYSLLRRINGETVLNEAKRMLLARAGVAEPDAGEQEMKLSRAFEELCPSLSEQVRALTNPDREPVADLQVLVDRRQSELAQQALRDADVAEIERAVQRLRQTFGDAPGDELCHRLREAVDDALRLAGADGGQRVVKIVSYSALGILASRHTDCQEGPKSPRCHLLVRRAKSEGRPTRRRRNLVALGLTR